MQIFNITKKGLASLRPLNLPNCVYNTEAQMFLIPGKWSGEPLVLKKLHHDSGEIFSNKLYTVNELIDKKNVINIEELVMPESLAAIDDTIIGFTMPYIPNVNLQELLDSKEIPIEKKVAYLKDVGLLLEKMSKVRKYTSISDFYLNDVHENNFILNANTGKINAVDLDSAKIGHNLTAPARYLSPFSQLPLVHKYIPLSYSAGGVYEVNENTEIYCYIIMIFNFFYGENIGKISISDFYVYLEYLSKLGISKEFLDKISYIYTGHSNENPYEYLDELIPYYGKTHRNTFNCVRSRMLLK